jgi:hypothetical protein
MSLLSLVKTMVLKRNLKFYIFTSDPFQKVGFISKSEFSQINEGINDVFKL